MKADTTFNTFGAMTNPCLVAATHGARLGSPGTDFRRQMLWES